ncbi:MAG: Na+/H+ antiporter subunit E [Burkholderiaceae bacterium]
MKKWFPAPWLSAALCAMWLLLNGSLNPGHILLGVLAGILAPLAVAPLRPRAPPLKRPGVLVRLVLRVGADVIKSAFDVLAGILRAGRRPPRGEFVVIPLELRDPHALAALAIISAVIPGTVWSELAPDSSELTMHVFDLEGEAEFIALFKSRYERPLKEIFE